VENQPRALWQTPREGWRQHNLLNQATCGPVNRIHPICGFFTRSASPLTTCHTHAVFAHPFIFLILFFPLLSLPQIPVFIYLLLFLYVCLAFFPGFTQRWEACGGAVPQPGSLRVPADARGWAGAGSCSGCWWAALLPTRGRCALQGAAEGVPSSKGCPLWRWVGVTLVTQIPNEFLMIRGVLWIFISKEVTFPGMFIIPFGNSRFCWISKQQIAIKSSLLARQRVGQLGGLRIYWTGDTGNMEIRRYAGSLGFASVLFSLLPVQIT